MHSKVKKIILRNGCVHGLEIGGQGLIKVDAVISTVSGITTFGLLLNPEDVPDKMRRKVRNAPLSHKALGIQLGLSNTIDVRSHTNGILPMMDEQYKYFTPDDAAAKWLVYSVPTVTIPELAPDGGSIVEMFPPIKQDLAVNDWNEQGKEKAVESAITALSRMHDMDIAVKRVLCPKDYQSRMHLYNGAIYGLSPAGEPGARFQHKTQVPGLYQAGQTTYPGYGVGPAAMSGIFAAEALMKTSHA